MDVVRFDDNSTTWTRAQQAYLILIGMAANRQTTQYGLLCQTHMRWGEAKGLPLRRPLGAIWAWCEERGLPKLNQLVVNADTGVPGDGAQAADSAAEQQRIFEYPWHTIVPPTAEELEAAYRRKWPNKMAA